MTPPALVAVLALAAAAPATVVSSDHVDQPLTGLSVFADAAGTLDLAAVRAGGEGITFKPIPGQPGFGFGEGVYWIHAVVRDDRPGRRDPLYLVVENNLVGHVEAFRLTPDGPERHVAGYLHVAEADVRHREPVFKLALAPGDNALYLRADAGFGAANFPLRLMDAEALDRRDARIFGLFGMFFGLALLMVVYNLFVAASLREKNSLYYALWVVSIATSMSVDHGLLQYALPSLARHTIALVGVTFGLGTGTAVLFGRSFLETRTHTPKLDLFLRVALGMAVLDVAASPFSFWLGMVAFPFLIGATYVLAGVAVWRWRRGEQQARYFAVAWVVFIVAATGSNFATTAESAQVLHYGVVVGSALQMVLFALALADRINVLNRQRLAVQAEALARQSALATSFARFVPRQFLEHLKLKDLTDVRLGDQVQLEMSVLFTDIRGFTEKSERMTPRETFEFINGYLKELGPEVRAHGGFVDKYIGDAIMALFPRAPDDAIAAGVGILKALRRLNERRGSDPVRMGIGVHTGRLMLGIVGEEERLQGTVIADAVNLASRVEGLSKYFGAAMVVTEPTLAGCAEKERFAHRPLGRVKVKGKQQAVLLYEVFEADEDAQRAKKVAGKARFEAALQAFFDGRFDEAGRDFEAALADNPEDGAARYYRGRCEAHLKEGVPEGWDGVEAFASK